MIPHVSLRLFRIYKRIYQTVRYRGIDLDKRRYILVVGVQRSGTNMVMEVFDRGVPYAAFSDSDTRLFNQASPSDLVDKGGGSSLQSAGRSAAATILTHDFGIRTGMIE